MFASILFADENDVRDFDLQIQNLLRIGRADEAAAILETALGEFGASRHPIAELCAACPVDAVEIVGWDALAARIAELDMPDAPITGLGIDISWPGNSGLEPDASASLEPNLETNYYHDGAFPFATAGRAALVEGYGPYGAEWQGGMADIDSLLGVQGLGALYGVIYPLVESVAATPAPDPLDADAMRLGAAFVAVRLHQAVARAVRRHGLPRPLAVIVGSNESYPFYDAPVFSAAESHDFAPVALDAVLIEALPTEELPAEELPAENVPSQPESGRDDEPQIDQPIDHAATDDNRVVQISGASLRRRLSQRQAEKNGVHPPVVAAGVMLRRLFAR